MRKPCWFECVYTDTFGTKTKKKNRKGFDISLSAGGGSVADLFKNKKTILKSFYWCGIISSQFKKIINQTGKHVCCSDVQITF